jgi:hypothetical protein
VTLQNCIVANSPSGSNWYGSAIDDGNNLSSDATPIFTAPGSRNNTDPKLGPLGDYGGPTFTIPLLEGSPAIDGGKPDFCPHSDQRGRVRPFGPACDIGAFESCPPYSIRGTITGYGEHPTLGLQGSWPPGEDPDWSWTNGTYCCRNLPAGSWGLACAADGTVFAPWMRDLTLGPDVVGADFKGYQMNALTPEPQTNGLRLVFAGNEGQAIRWLSSTTLSNWEPVLTSILGTDRLAEYLETNTSSPPARFYQVLSP